MNIELLKCSVNSSIRDALKIINNNLRGTVFVVNEEDKVYGVVTDGDVRRALLNGYGLNDSIKVIIKPDFIYARDDEGLEDINSKFTSAIKIMPVVDKNMRLVNYAEFHEKVHLPLVSPQLDGNEYKYLMDAFFSTWISSKGEYITRFENSFAEYCGMRYGVATSNGTTALHLALVALGIGEGDEVIVPDLTFAATINAVIYTGATPVIVDVEEDGWCMSPEALEDAITGATKAVIPVHVYGQPCDMGSICSIAKEHNLFIVEDCAEAHGAEWGSQKVGSFGVISCFSFFGNKVITTGEGGMCLTDSEELRQKMMHYRDHGMSNRRRYYHDVVGFNYRMTNLQAAIGVAQVERIDDILEWRKNIEERFFEHLSHIRGVEIQHKDLKNRKKIAWLVSILIEAEARERVVEALENQGIEVRLFFSPLSKMEIYRKYAKNCIVSCNIAKRGINLPTTHEISDETIKRIAMTIEENI